MPFGLQDTEGRERLRTRGHEPFCTVGVCHVGLDPNHMPDAKPPPDYADFVVRWSADSEGAYTATVVQSPEGEAEDRFEPPVTKTELGLLAEGFARVVAEGRRRRRAARGWPRDLVTASLGGGHGDPTEIPLSPRQLGERLFRALFGGSVGDRFFQSLGSASKQGLRLKLQMNLETPELGSVHSLPWEYLFRPDTATFLATEPRLSLVRYPTLPVSGGAPPKPKVLRVLLAVAAPKDAPPLRLGEEAREISRVWRTQRGIDVELVVGATLDRLVARLAAREFHVLHFMGHGTVDPVREEGVLLLESEGRVAEAIPGSELKVQLASFETLRLIVLNACQSGRAARAGAATSVATALLQGGFSAVIAHQYPITDDAARAFSADLYESLARHGQVDAAVAAGRRAIRRRCPGSVEWGVPVLFLRAPSGLLFDHGVSESQSEGRVAHVSTAPSNRSASRSGLARWVPFILGLLLIGILAVWKWELIGRLPGVVSPHETSQWGEDNEESSLHLLAAEGPFELRAGEILDLPQAGVSVGLHFENLSGLPLAVLTIRPAEGDAFTRAVRRGDVVTVRDTDAPRPWSFTVLAVNEQAQTVTLDDR